MTTLESTDIDQAREYLDRTRNRVIEVTTGLSAEQWQFKPAPDRWSIAENLEHVVIVRERVLGRLRNELAQAPAPGPEHDRQQVDAIVLEKIPDRTVTVKAPEFLDPCGQWTPAEALERLSRNYEHLMEYIETTPDIREHVLDAPPLRIVTNGAFQMMDGYQWALTVAAHDERHVRQMLEVKAHPNYPSS